VTEGGWTVRRRKDLSDLKRRKHRFSGLQRRRMNVE
jgi:hypothetical protein